MRIDTLKNALLGVTSKCYHYAPPQNVNGAYIVWAEDNQSASVWCDNKMQAQAIEGTVDYFTKSEDDAYVDAIQAALNGVCSWRLNSIQHEEDTGYIHYEWVWALWLG
jgi:hypothetical protein